MLTQLRKTLQLNLSTIQSNVMFTFEFRTAFFFLPFILKLSPDKKLSKEGNVSFLRQLLVTWFFGDISEKTIALSFTPKLAYRRFCAKVLKFWRSPIAQFYLPVGTKLKMKY